MKSPTPDVGLPDSDPQPKPNKREQFYVIDTDHGELFGPFDTLGEAEGYAASCNEGDAYEGPYLPSEPQNPY